MSRKGYCKCGCGQKTTIAPFNDTKHGYVKGDHARCVLTIVDGDQLPRRRHGANDGPNTFYGPTNVEA